MAECRTCGATFHVGDPHDCPGPRPGGYLLLDVVIAFFVGSVLGGLVGIPLAEGMGEPFMRNVCAAVAIAGTFLFMRNARRSRARSRQ